MVKAAAPKGDGSAKRGGLRESFPTTFHAAPEAILPLRRLTLQQRRDALRATLGSFKEQFWRILDGIEADHVDVFIVPATERPFGVLVENRFQIFIINDFGGRIPPDAPGPAARHEPSLRGLFHQVDAAVIVGTPSGGPYLRAINHVLAGGTPRIALIESLPHLALLWERWIRTAAPDLPLDIEPADPAPDGDAA